MGKHIFSWTSQQNITSRERRIFEYYRISSNIEKHENSKKIETMLKEGHKIYRVSKVSGHNLRDIIYEKVYRRYQIL